MFSNLNWYNVAVLVLLALFIFGDRLPKAVADGLRMLRNLRRMAQSATTDLSRELGTDIQLEDLHPKAFIRKHVFSEAEQDALIKPLKGLSEELRTQTQGIGRELRDVGTQAESDLRGLGRPVPPQKSAAAPVADAPAPVAEAVPAADDTPAPVADTPSPRRSYDDIT